MISPDPALVDQLTVRAEFGRVWELVALNGGSNNRVYRAECERGRAVLKCYFRSQADPRDRLGAEFAFCRYAAAAGIEVIPRAIASDSATGLGLFAFVEGVRPKESSASLVSQAAEFVRAVNAERDRRSAASLPLASEACFSIEEHLGVVGGRANRLGDIAPESAIDRDALRFVLRELLPAWRSIRDAARAEAGEGRRALRSSMVGADRVVSPSDFGFHNALVRSDGRAVFLDFEYAGWDDPSKLICDFFCQPEVPVPIAHFDAFATAILGGSSRSGPILDRARLLLPVYRVKWICIRLNEFLPGGSARRQFSTREGIEIRKAEKLSNARGALASVLRRERIVA